MISVRKKRKQRGLAIVELLLVFAILGVIAVVIVLASGFIQKANAEKSFQQFQQTIITAANSYIEKYRDALPASELCINIPYQNLTKEDLLQESDYRCNATGIVSVYQDKSKDNYELYLTCKNVHNDKVVYQREGNPNECIRANGNFAIQIVSMKEENNGILQDYLTSDWATGKIRLELSAYSPYFYPIQEFQYSLDDGQTYETIAGNELVLEENIQGKIKIRAMDTNHDYSTEKNIYVKLDNTIPIPIIKGMGLSTPIDTGTYVSQNVILSGALENNPISAVQYDWYSCSNMMDISSCAKVSENTEKYQATSNGIYRVKATTSAGLYSYSSPFEVKIDKTAYQIRVNSSENTLVTITNNSTGNRSTSSIAARVGDQITVTVSDFNHTVLATYDSPNNLVFGTANYQFGNKSNTFIMDRSDMTISVS